MWQNSKFLLACAHLLSVSSWHTGKQPAPEQQDGTYVLCQPNIIINIQLHTTTTFNAGNKQQVQLYLPEGI